MMDAERGVSEVCVMVGVLVKMGSGRVSEGKLVRGSGNDVGAGACVVPTECALESVFPGFVTVGISRDEVTAGSLDNSAEGV